MQTIFSHHLLLNKPPHKRLDIVFLVISAPFPPAQQGPPFSLAAILWQKSLEYHHGSAPTHYTCELDMGPLPWLVHTQFIQGRFRRPKLPRSSHLASSFPPLWLTSSPLSRCPLPSGCLVLLLTLYLHQVPLRHLWPQLPGPRTTPPVSNLPHTFPPSCAAERLEVAGGGR